MISQFWQLIIAFAVVSIGTVVFVNILIRRAADARSRRVEPVGVRELKDFHVRKGLTDFLARHEIVGDADIRDGVVLAPVSDDQVETLAMVLRNAAAMLSRLPNPSSCSLYVRDSVNDRFMLVSDLDLDHLLDASRVMQHVAERRKS